MLRRLSASGILGLSLVLGGFTASAQMPIEQSDRPGEADPPTVLPKGAIQLEGGVRFERETGGDDPDTGTLKTPDLTVRVGLVDWLELRLELDGLLYEFRDGASDLAGADLLQAFYLGFKFDLRLAHLPFHEGASTTDILSRIRSSPP